MSPTALCGFVDTFHKSFYNSLNWYGTVTRDVRCPLGIGLPALRGQYCFGFRHLLVPPVRLWSKRVAVTWLYQAPETNRKSKSSLVRVEIVSLDFHSAKSFIAGFAVCFNIIIMLEHDVACIV